MSTLPWIALATGDLNDAKAATLISAVASNALASGQTDPVPNLILGVVNELRGAIGFSGKYQVSETEGTIPPNLKDMAVQKIIRDCKKRLEQQYTQDDRDDEATYQKRLERIQNGDYPIDQPDDPMLSAPSVALGKVSEVVPPCRRFRRCQLDGL
jgi:hypothetical protein